MECLSCYDKVYRSVRECGRVRAAVDNLKVVVAREIFPRGLAHGFIWFDADHAVAILEEHLRRDPRPASDIGDPRVLRQPASLSEKRDDLPRVIRSIPNVIGYAI